MNFGEVCPVCFDEYQDAVRLSCNHRICRKCVIRLIPLHKMMDDRECEDMIAKANGVVDLENFGVACPYRCTTGKVSSIAYDVGAFDYAVELNVSDFSMNRTVVCFLIDGSEKYMPMTIRAINSLMTSTPQVFIGILVPRGYDITDLYSRFIDPTRVLFREFRKHFKNWNPTQYKLDILQFADEFDTVFWLDSDTFVYRNITQLIMDFNFSSCKFAFLRDHVCTNPEFLSHWKDKNNPFVPQACFMGFKRDAMYSFFQLWEDMWLQWIEPYPFCKYPNPVPSFPGSAFCIEQYALGMALEQGKINREDIFEIKRICIPLNETAFSKPGDLQNKLFEELAKKFWTHLSFSSSFNGLEMSSLLLTSTSTSGSSYWIDDLEGHIIHFYSLNYDVTWEWWTNYSADVIDKIEEYWNTYYFSKTIEN